MSLKPLLDEHFAEAVAERLRQAGHDAVSDVADPSLRANRTLKPFPVSSVRDAGSSRKTSRTSGRYCVVPTTAARPSSNFSWSHPVGCPEAANTPQPRFEPLSDGCTARCCDKTR